MWISVATSYHDDTVILAKIKHILSSRATYGYRRVTAVLNAQRHAQGLSNVNHKRTYRIMQENDLLLCRYANKALRVHDGKIITLRSNTRWCSDGFYITCDNAERVQVAFSLDTCDREAMRFIASTKGIDIETDLINSDNNFARLLLNEVRRDILQATQKIRVVEKLKDNFKNNRQQGKNNGC